MRSRREGEREEGERGLCRAGAPFTLCKREAVDQQVLTAALPLPPHQGPGVIGMYPLLRPGDEPVDYCSQCQLRTPSGTMEGGFEFVRGSNDAPLGAPFEATCARAQLAVPAYIF